ncbi:MAG TPA: hypothetical protein VKP14_06020 [Gaiellaceae bacterium]|nr:hypothetical protein [Gaiellaceae bacterium]
MAEDVTTTTEPAAASPRPVAPHKFRFGLIYGGLGAVLAGAIVIFVLYAGRSISPAPTWSSWKPSGGGEGAAKQIAEHVAQAYRLSSGAQLVDVIAKAPAVSPASTVSIPIHYVAIRGTKGKGDQIFPISSSNSIMYALCGLGSSCAIATGKPSVERGTLVRREILELALYTFKYVGGIKSVIAFMPPALGTQPKYVVYLQKGDVKPQLHAPLRETLGPKVPLPTTIPAREVHTVDAVTESRVYSFSLSQAQQGDAILVLAPLAA